MTEKTANADVREDDARKFREKTEKEAEGILENEDKMERFLQRLEKKFQSLPKVGDTLSCIPLMASLVRSYVKREYQQVPLASMLAIVLALLYFLSPIDLIPDAIPGVGYVDDCLVLALCLKLVDTDLQDYRTWREKNGKVFADLPDYEKVIQETEDNKVFAPLVKLARIFMGKSRAIESDSKGQESA